MALGIRDPGKAVQTSARTPEEALKEAVTAGIPIMEGRPDDPMLAFLDL